MCSVKYVFYFTREVDNNYISFVASPLTNINIVYFTREIKDIKEINQVIITPIEIKKNICFLEINIRL